MTEYKKEDDYTLLVTNRLPTGGTLCRYFNFAAGQVTSIFTQRADLEKSQGYTNPSISVSTSLTSQMQIQSFSSFDYKTEIQEMHKILKAYGGTPPELDEKLTGKINKPGNNKLG